MFIRGEAAGHKFTDTRRKKETTFVSAATKRRETEDTPGFSNWLANQVAYLSSVVHASSLIFRGRNERPSSQASLAGESQNTWRRCVSPSSLTLSGFPAIMLYKQPRGISNLPLRLNVNPLFFLFVSPLLERDEGDVLLASKRNKFSFV